jgi:early secretory antigenic target protein ESAT-6
MTNDGTLVVNFAALQAASSDISRAITALGSGLDDLELKARPLVATWQGSAQEAYAVRQARWKQAAGDLATVLHQIRSALDSSAHEYLQTEQRNARQFPG